MKFFTGIFQILVFKNFIDNMVIAISLMLKTLYYQDQAMEKQIDNGDDEAHKVYIKLINQWFSRFVWELIKIIDDMPESLIV